MLVCVSSVVSEFFIAVSVNLHHEGSEQDISNLNLYALNAGYVVMEDMHDLCAGVSLEMVHSKF